jgi:hypothetical protein
MNGAPDDFEADLHPLFADHELSNEEIGFLEVRRFQGGRYLLAPRKFAPDEIDSPETLHANFGGGDYEVIAKRHNGRVCGRVKLSLDGAPRSLDPLMQDAEVPRVATPVAAPSGDSGSMLPLMMQMMMAQQQQTTQLIVAVLNKGEERSREYVASMQQLHHQHAQAMAAQQAQTLELVGRFQTSNSGGIETFMKGLEFARSQEPEDVIEEVTGDDGVDPAMETIAEIAGHATEFMKARENMRGQAPTQAPPANVAQIFPRPAAGEQEG